jgi:hypothetical protein
MTDADVDDIGQVLYSYGTNSGLTLVALKQFSMLRRACRKWYSVLQLASAFARRKLTVVRDTLWASFSEIVTSINVAVRVVDEGHD